MKLYRILGLSLLALFLSISIAQAQSKTLNFPGTIDGAKQLLEVFMKPGADVKKLSMELAPTQADFKTYFVKAVVGKAENVYGPAWEKNQIVIGPKPGAGQTELIIWSSTTDEIKSWTGVAAKQFPGGYQRIGKDLNPGITVYRFKFVKPGETLGMAYDGLVFMNNHWTIFPKPWRAVGQK